MAKKNIIGAYINDSYLTLCNSSKESWKTIALRTSLADKPQALEESEIISSIQIFLDENAINQPIINLSFPVKNIIFRSFILPQMSPQELQNAVGFEAKKYIPFSVDELVYRFESIPFTQKNIKKTLILFVAIKKEILEKYYQIFSSVNGKILTAEPSCVSLLRLLVNRKKVSPAQRSIILEVENSSGSITIFEGQTPGFARDFKLNHNKDLDTEPSEKSSALISSLINEIRISLDFYKRQYPASLKKDTKQHIFVFSDTFAQETTAAVIKEFSLDATAISPQEFINLQQAQDFDYSCLILNAFSATLHSLTKLTSDVDLFRAFQNLSGRGDSSNNENYGVTLKTITVCALILGILLWFSHSQSLPYIKQLSDLQIKEEQYKDIPTAALEKETSRLRDTNRAYQSIRLKSDFSSLLKDIPSLLPSGVWLSNLSLRHQDISDPLLRDRKKGILIELQGYSYAEQLGLQINLIEEFMDQLREHDLFDENTVALELIKKEEVENFSVTSFKIALQAKEKND